MNLKFRLHHLRRRMLLLMAVVALVAALMPTAVFASGYGHQGRAYNPGPRDHYGHYQPKKHKQQHKNYNHYHNKGKSKYHAHCDATYRVKKGDTLSKISKHFRVSINKIAKANNIKNTNKIFVGQVLCIP